MCPGHQITSKRTDDEDWNGRATARLDTSSRFGLVIRLIMAQLPIRTGLNGTKVLKPLKTSRAACLAGTAVGSWLLIDEASRHPRQESQTSEEYPGRSPRPQRSTLASQPLVGVLPG